MPALYNLLFVPLVYEVPQLDATRVPALGIAFAVLLTYTLGCLVILLLCIPVFAQTSSLHINLKFLLIFSLLSHLTMIVSEIHYYITGMLALSSPNYQEFVVAKSEAKDFADIIHEIGYGLTLQSSFWLILERFLASIRPEKYEKRSRPNYYFLTGAIAISVIFSSGFAYIFHALSLFVLGGAFVALTEPSLILASFTISSFYYHKWRNEKLFGSATLGARYQMHEVLAYSRAIIPACLVSTCIRSLGAIPLLLWITGGAQRIYLRTVMFPIHATSCVVMKILLISAHRGLLKTVENVYGTWLSRLFCRKNIIMVQPMQLENQSADAHFKMLKAAWEELPEVTS